VNAEDTAAVRPRSDRWLLLARTIAAVTVAGIVAAIWLGVLESRSTGAGPFANGLLSDLGFVITFGTFPVIGYVLATRRPENSLGWLLQGIGAVFGISAFTDSFASYAIRTGASPHLGALVAAINGPTWLPIVVLPATFLLLLFPDGHLPSPRWRWFARVLAVGFVLICLLIILSPGRMTDSGYPQVVNPIGVEALRPILPVALGLLAVIPIGVVGSLASLVMRFRRSTGIERLQLRWLVTAAAIVGVLYTLTFILSWDRESTLLQTVAILSFGLIPIAIGVSVLRYRLFDIDVVINRAVLFGALAVFITVVYVAIVVGVGALVGSQASPVLSAAAAAVVALAFQPLRRRAQRLADRLVYGKRATPYEVLSELSERVGHAYATEDLLPRMARALGEGTGAARADVWIRVGDELRPEATWPADVPVLPARSATDEAQVTGSSIVEPVRHQGELLGALSIEKRPGESATGVERKLVADLAAQAGLVLRNAALTEDLLETIEELRRSRQRLVAAQDEERRRLERNLHDGAQQQLVALNVKLGLLERLVERDPAQARSIASQLQGDANDALEELRDLARGIYPPLLADRGLVAALESQARKSAVPVEIEAEGVGRYAREAEAAVYFSCLEALQNVAKYASASRATVRLTDGDGRLRFEVTDDGAGFDTTSSSYGTGLQGIADRLSALDGELEVRSAPGAGTTLVGTLPAREPAEPATDASSGGPGPAER
jgi:signal transduction histidine kinase